MAGGANLIVAGGLFVGLVIDEAVDVGPYLIAAFLFPLAALIEYRQLRTGLSRAHPAPPGVAVEARSAAWLRVARWGLLAAALLSVGVILGGSWWFTFVVLQLVPLGCFRLASAWHVARLERTLGVRYHHARRGWFEEGWDLTYAPPAVDGRLS